MEKLEKKNIHDWLRKTSQKSSECFQEYCFDKREFANESKLDDISIIRYNIYGRVFKCRLTSKFKVKNASKNQ